MKNIVVATAKRTEEDFVAYEKVPVAKWAETAIDGEGLLTHAFLMDTFRKIMGRTLTLIDSSIPEKQQNKAMKNITRQIFSDEMDFAAEWCFDQQKLNKMANESYEKAVKDGTVMDPVTIEEALGVEQE